MIDSNKSKSINWIFQEVPVEFSLYFHFSSNFDSSIIIKCYLVKFISRIGTSSFISHLILKRKLFDPQQSFSLKHQSLKKKIPLTWVQLFMMKKKPDTTYSYNKIKWVHAKNATQQQIDTQIRNLHQKAYFYYYHTPKFMNNFKRSLLVEEAQSNH